MNSPVGKPAALRLIHPVLLSLLGGLALNLLTQTLSASHITLQVSAITRVNKQAQATCTVSVLNQGDETAANLQVQVESGGRLLSAPPRAALPAGQTHESIFSVPTDALMIGRHFLVILIDYTDTSGYPFTAMAHANLVIGEDMAPQIQGSIEPIELDQAARLHVKLSSSDRKIKQLQLRLLLPKELSVSRPSQDLELQPSEVKTLSFEVNNLSAVAGSIYSVFVLAEYSAQGRHTGLIIPGTIRIEPGTNIFQRNRTVILFAAGFLAVLLVGAQFYSRKRLNRKKPQK